MQKVRSSNIELFRILSMIAIVLSHYVYHGGLLYQPISGNQILAQLLKIGGKLGVTCFVLISAYYLLESKFKIQKVLQLCMEISFYALLIILVKYLAGGISLVECLKSLLAPIYEVYWFPTAYIGMYFLFPFLNIVIDKIKDRIDKVFVLLTILFCLINFFFISSNFLYSNLIWFIYLYFVAAWNKYSNCRIKRRSKLIAICSIVCIWWSSVFFNLVGEHFAIEEVVHKAYYLSEIASPFIVCAGIALFNYFNQLSIKK